MSRGAALNVVKSGASRVRMLGHDVGGRQKDDFYPTPARGIESLLSVEKFSGPIWEPACGDGAISKVLLSEGYDVISSDLVDRGYGKHGVDFRCVGVKREWLADCECGQNWLGPTYHAVEDDWRQHVHALTGTEPTSLVSGQGLRRPARDERSGAS